MASWTPERWDRIESLFHVTAGLAPDQRRSHLDRECGTDEALRVAVERLIAADRGRDDFVDSGFVPDSHLPDPLLQRRFGPYLLLARVAEGGMGTVYRGERCDGAFEQTVAIKVLRIGLLTPSMRERFERERRILAGLEHPNVARLIDGGTTEDGIPYLVMEFVDGMRCDRWCDERRLSLRERLQLFGTVCRAVHFVHQNLVVHLDLKPTNVLVDRTGPRLVDFGIAGFLETERGGSEGVASTRSRPLTPEYASPELLRGERVTTAADVYSLGIVLYELLTGVRAIRQAGSDVVLLREVCETDVARASCAFVDGESTDRSPTAAERACKRAATPRELRKLLGGDLDRIVAKAVHKDPAHRYSSVQDLVEDVDRWLGGFPVRARGDGFGYRARRFLSRNAPAVVLAAGALTALVLGLISTLHMAAVAENERDVANHARRDLVLEAEHARIETTSYKLVASFLGETLLSGHLATDPEQRTRFLATIQRKAKQARVQQAGNPHLRANLLDALGNACASVDAFDEAEKLLLEAMELRATAFGVSSMEYALSLGSMGRIYFRTGRLEVAREALRAAHRLHAGDPQSIHADIALAANDLAAVERALGNREQARSLHLEALALRRKGGDPVLVAESLNNLANSETDLRVAAELLQESYRLREESLGRDDPLTIQSLANRGMLALSTGDLEGAHAFLADAAGRSRTLGALGADGLGMTLRPLAYCMLRAGDMKAARSAIEEAIAVERARFGDKHLRVVAALEVRAKIDEQEGLWSAAVATWKEVLDVRRAALPAGNREIGLSLLSLGGAEVLGGDPATGLATIDECKRELERDGPIRAVDLADLQRMRAVALRRLDRIADAKVALREGLAGLGEPPVDAARARALREHLARLESEVVR